MSWQGIQDPEGQFIGWAPGRGPIVSPEGMPWRLERGADLVVELHMLATDVPRAIQPTVALFFTDQPPAAAPLTLKMGSKLIDIPAGKSDYVVTDAYVLPVPFDLLSVYPHAHYLATDMRVTAALPDGTVKSLLSHQALELSLAAGLPLRHADRASRRHDADDAVHVRQLGAESREPASPAGARAARAAVDGRDGGAGPAGPAEIPGGCGDAGPVVRRSRRRRERRARRGARARVAQQRRIPGVPGRRVSSRWGDLPTRFRTCRRRSG